MASSVYIETTIVSYLTARPSRDLVQRAHQQLTRRWWRTRRPQFDLYVSPLVIQEAAGGDRLRASRWLAALKAVPVLDATSNAMQLAEALHKRVRFRRKRSWMRRTSRLQLFTGWPTS